MTCTAGAARSVNRTSLTAPPLDWCGRSGKSRCLRDPAPLQRPPDLHHVLGAAKIRVRHLLEAVEAVAERVRVDDQGAGALLDPHAAREVLPDAALERRAEVPELA